MYPASEFIWCRIFLSSRFYSHRLFRSVTKHVLVHDYSKKHNTGASLAALAI